MTILPVLGVLAGIISILDAVPYIRDVMRGRTRPHRGTWLIWSSLALVALASQLADGAEWSVVMVAVQALATGVIFAFSIRRGEGGLSPVDITLITIAALGVMGWLVFSEPVVATACVVAADTLGVAMMLPKTWRDPASETLVTYVLASAAGLLSTFAVGAIEASLLLYPAYFFLANGLIAVVIVSRRKTADAPVRPGFPPR
jgi:hypothetical protein